jgi:hypothetical protein
VCGHVGCAWVELCSGDTDNALWCASGTGVVSLAMYAYQLGDEPWSTEAMHAAVLSGSVSLMRALYEHGCPWDWKTVDVAARSGHAQCLQFAMSRGCPFLPEAMESAADGGHLDCMQVCPLHSPYVSMSVWSV